MSLRTALVLFVVVMVFFAASGWFAERQSCERQQLPRQAGNARKAAIDALVRGIKLEGGVPNQAEVDRLTEAVPSVPPLQCKQLLPATH